MKLTYSEKLKDPRWQRKRLEVLNRDKFTCRECGSDDKMLHVHHCLYPKGEPWEVESEYLLTLCEACHERRQSLEHDVKLEFFRLISRITCEQLSEVMAGIISAGASGVENGLVLQSLSDYAFDSEIRWYQEALENPQIRSAYEKLTGTRPNWEAK